MGYRAIRTQRWKYIRFNELEGMDELYDLQHDPYELHNVIDLPESAKTLNTLRVELDRQWNRSP